MSRMSELHADMEMEDNQFEIEMHQKLCELISNLQIYMTAEELSLMCWATGVSKAHIAHIPEIENE